MFSCFGVPLSGLSTFFDHFATSLCVPGWFQFLLQNLNFSGFLVLCHYFPSPFPVFKTTSPGLSEIFSFEHTALFLLHTCLVYMMLPLPFASVL